MSKFFYLLKNPHYTKASTGREKPERQNYSQFMSYLCHYVSHKVSRILGIVVFKVTDSNCTTVHEYLVSISKNIFFNFLRNFTVIKEYTDSDDGHMMDISISEFPSYGNSENIVSLESFTEGKLSLISIYVDIHIFEYCNQQLWVETFVLDSRIQILLFFNIRHSKIDS